MITGGNYEPFETINPTSKYKELIAKFKNRQKTHNSSHPNNIHISLVFETDNINEVENCLKSVLKSKQYRKRKEFYQIDIDSIKKIIDKCESATLIAKGKNVPTNFDKYYLMIVKE